jgi:methionine synthase I (cobalamin-dependent)
VGADGPVTTDPASAGGLRDRLRTGTLRLDAAMGTALLGRGLRGPAPSWNLSRPGEVLAVHREHVAAGAELVLTNTFVGASAEEASAALRIARDSGARFVAASLYAGLVDLERQIEQLAGADCLWLETATSAQMALDAVRRALPSGLPIVITCAMRRAPLEELRSSGAVAAGYNCSPWPEDEPQPTGKGAAFADVLKLDGAGLPAGAWARAVGSHRARIVGGCCGTTASHLAALFRPQNDGSSESL